MDEKSLPLEALLFHSFCVKRNVPAAARGTIVVGAARKAAGATTLRTALRNIAFDSAYLLASYPAITSLAFFSPRVPEAWMIGLSALCSADDDVGRFHGTASQSFETPTFSRPE